MSDDVVREYHEVEPNAERGIILQALAGEEKAYVFLVPVITTDADGVNTLVVRMDTNAGPADTDMLRMLLEETLELLAVRDTNEEEDELETVDVLYPAQ